MSSSLNIVDVSEATFERDVIQKSHDMTVVVDFWAAWCGPCRMLGPVLEKLANEPASDFLLAKVDVDANPGLSMRYGVQGIPAVKAFRNGKVVGQFVGAQPEPMVRQFVKSVAPTEGDQTQVAADELVARRRWDEAEQLYRKILTAEPGNHMVRLGLARSMLAQGKGCQAGPYLEELLNDSATLAQAERLIPVAAYLCRHSESPEESDELTVIEAQYRQSARLLGRGKFAPALDGLLEVLRHNKNHRNGEARQVVVGLFELLGDEDPLTSAYRRELAMILF
jgi:putative thioredoxin